MSNYDTAKTLLASFSGQETIIGVPRTYCRLMGSLEGGVFLSQVVFWSDKGGGEPGWFYKSFEEWEEQLFLSKYKVKKFTARLEELGILETKVKKAGGAPTTHYRLDWRKFTDWISKFLTMEKQVFTYSITETTTETTKDIATSASENVEDEPNAADAWFGEKEKSPQEHEPVDWSDEEVRRDRVAGATRSYMRRAGQDEPWHMWNVERIQARGAVSKASLQHVGWLVEQITGYVPNSDAMWKLWRPAYEAMYLEAEGDFKIIEEAIKNKWDVPSKYRTTKPARYIEEVGKVRAGRQSSPNKITVRLGGGAEWLR
jgi:hypothetical protein